MNNKITCNKNNIDTIKILPVGKSKDLTNHKFGHLTVMFRGENSKNENARWWCECDCGNPELVLVCSNHLQNGHTQSCGCMQKENAKLLFKKYNRYDLSGKYGIGFTSNYNKYGENYFYFDLEDYEKIKDYCWSFNDQNYVVSKGKGNVNLRIHRIIMNVEDKSIQVDHIHGIKTRNDNRKTNLRLATNQENVINSKLSKNNTSGVTGVSWDNTYQYWIAQICYNGKNIHLGCFQNKIDAIKIRKEAEEKYFGEWSYDNSQKMLTN